MHGLRAPQTTMACLTYETIAIKDFYRRLNAMACLIVLLFGLIAWIFSFDSPAKYLTYTVNGTVVETLSVPCHVGALFVAALSIQTVALGIGGCRGWVDTTMTNNLTLPLLHVGILTGIADIVDVWAVFAVVSLVMLMQCILRSAVSHQPRYTHSDAVAIALYIIFWVLVWRVQPKRTQTHKAVQLGCFTLGLCAISAVYIVATRRVVPRQTKPSDTTVDMTRAVMHTCTTVGFSMVSVASWIAENDGGNAQQWIGVVAVLVGYVVWCVFIVKRLQFVSHKLKSEPEIELVDHKVSKAGNVLFDSDSETDISADDPYTVANVSQTGPYIGNSVAGIEPYNTTAIHRGEIRPSKE